MFTGRMVVSIRYTPWILKLWCSITTSNTSKTCKNGPSTKSTATSMISRALSKMELRTMLLWNSIHNIDGLNQTMTLTMTWILMMKMTTTFPVSTWPGSWSRRRQRSISLVLSPSFQLYLSNMKIIWTKRDFNKKIINYWHCP